MLAVSTLAFGASSIYLWQQLKSERARSAEVVKTTGRLHERVLEIEGARAGSADPRRTTAWAVPASRVPARSGGAVTSPSQVAPVSGETEAGRGLTWTGPRPDQSPAFRKMMRSQMRASNKRLYADVGRELGLNDEEADKLVDLLTEQQLEGFDQMHDAADPAEANRRYEHARREQQAAISDLIGADRAMSLQEYQETLPARQDFEMLARQLEDHDVALSEDQRERLLAAYVDERKRVPMPQYIDGTDGAEFARQLNAWQDDYNARVGGEAETILNSDQLTTYSAIQQWQREMREQFAAMTPDDRGPMAGGTIARGNVYFTAAAPAVAVSTGVATPAPLPAPDAEPRAAAP
jgi:hypothetical protein